jgi:hypothetical protein
LTVNGVSPLADTMSIRLTMRAALSLAPYALAEKSRCARVSEQERSNL